MLGIPNMLENIKFSGILIENLGVSIIVKNNLFYIYVFTMINRSSHLLEMLQTFYLSDL